MEREAQRPNPRPDAPSAIEFDAEEAQGWIAAVDAGGATELVADEATGVFGSRVALLDFDPDDLDRLHRLAPSVGLAAHPALESALAISGSSAQGRVQLFPGDADFFERAHIRAPTAEAAARVLREVMHATAVRALSEPDVVLVEVNLGAYPVAVVERGRPRAAGDPITWSPADVVDRAIDVTDADSRPLRLSWDEVPIGASWVYVGWIVAERELGRIALASVMVDATWEDPAGVICALDGAVDPLAQEVYLDPATRPLVERLLTAGAPGAADGYRRAMTAEVRHYTVEQPDFAKAAKRLYNLCRVADELEAAAYVRELFDEPTARLYQVPGLLEAADLARDPGSGLALDVVLRQLDTVADAIADVTDGSTEAHLLAELARLRARARLGPGDEAWETMLADVRARCAAIVNEFFRERLFAHRRVAEILEGIGTG